MARLTKHIALDIFTKSNAIPLNAAFHSLNSDQINGLQHFADELKYRQPRHANGSRLRYFHAYVKRTAQKAD